MTNDFKALYEKVREDVESLQQENKQLKDTILSDMGSSESPMSIDGLETLLLRIGANDHIGCFPKSCLY